MRRLPALQDCPNLSDQHEGRVVSQGICGGDVYGAVDQQTRERGREQPCATRGHHDGDRVGHRHARKVARAHEGREHVAGAPELDAQDGRLGGQKRNARAHRPERAVQQQVEHHAHRGRRDARHGHLPLASRRGQDAHRHKVADARHETHRADDPHRRHRAGERLAGHEQDHGLAGQRGQGGWRPRTSGRSKTLPTPTLDVGGGHPFVDPTYTSISDMLRRTRPHYE